MSGSLRVALAQIDIASLDPVSNLTSIVDMCAAAAEASADLVVFPELVNLGQVPGFDGAFAVRYAELAQPLDGPFISTVRDVARDRGQHIALGVALRDDRVPGLLRNSAVLIAGDGEVVGVQHKLHLPGEERHYFRRGDRVKVMTCDLGTLSLQICYDLYFPEVARVAALEGSALLVGLANIPHRSDWPDRLAHLATVRAYENMQHVALVNRIGHQHGYDYGGEGVVAAPPGRLLAQGPLGEEALILADLDRSLVLAERMRRPVFADRRADVYGTPGPPIREATAPAVTEA